MLRKPSYMREVVGLMVSAWLAVTAAGIAQAASAEQIESSLRKGVDYLYKQQTKTGHWELTEARTGPGENSNFKDNDAGQDTGAAQWTGRTALAVDALLASGEKPQDPRIQQAVDFLLKNDSKGVYALGLRCQVWMLMPQTAPIKAAMLKDANVLRTSMRTDGTGKGMYNYVPGAGKAYSHSRSQYAVLGMWAAAQTGVEIPDVYWRTVEEGWIRNQTPDGGWSYKNVADDKNPHPATVGMTAVGVATLFITQEYLRPGEGISCKGNPTNPAIEKGLAWITKNADRFAVNDRSDRNYPYPSLYAVERIGVASGLSHFGTVNWFEKGADFLLKEQGRDGDWDRGKYAFPNTCFAMLFLAKGRAPVVISKLKYADASGKESNWNQRPRDAANVAKWIGKTLERDLSFQIVSIDAPMGDLLESPILYIAGNEPVVFSGDSKAKLKKYMESGGLLLANADCGALGFATSMKKLAAELFPDYEFAELPKDDLIYTNYYPSTKWKTKPSVLRLSNGARPLMLLIPQADAGKAWQTRDVRVKSELFELGADVMLFATDNKKLRYRGSPFYVPDDASVKPASTIDIARLKYGGVWDPEPAGWNRLNNILSKKDSIGLAVTTPELGKGQIGSAKIAHLTGTYDYKFSQAQTDELKKFVADGGTLVIDVAGGGGKAATSMEAMLANAFPDGKLELIPPEHPLYTAGGGAKDEIAYRSYAIKNGVGQSNAPRLQGITLNGRLAVIYSREDLSVGLVGQEIDGIVGYSPTTATKLMTRILRFAAGK